MMQTLGIVLVCLPRAFFIGKSACLITSFKEWGNASQVIVVPAKRLPIAIMKEVVRFLSEKRHMICRGTID